jgi:hypothetical protein
MSSAIRISGGRAAGSEDLVERLAQELENIRSPALAGARTRWLGR